MSYNGDYVGPSPDAGTSTPTAAPSFAPPDKDDAVAVALTVGIVGVCMFALITWLVLRLRRQPQDHSTDTPQSRRFSSVTARFRPSFASEASSRFGFKRKSLRLVNNSNRQHDDESWDFADPDPIQKVELAHPAKYIPPPLLSPTSPSYHSTKDESTPSSPATPLSFDLEPPPPAYTRDSARWTVYEPKDLP
ncbi:hypothetical protein J3A83DRAFT_4185134 [Scleroderma citrinum]